MMGKLGQTTAQAAKMEILAYTRTGGPFELYETATTMKRVRMLSFHWPVSVNQNPDDW